MEVPNQKDGLDANFRHNALNLIVKKLKEFTRNSGDPNVVQIIRAISSKFELVTFEKSTSRDHCVTNIKEGLPLAKNTLIRALGRSSTENQITNTMIQRPVAQSYPAEQNLSVSCSSTAQQNMLLNHLQSSQQPMGTSLTSIQTRDGCLKSSVNRFHQDCLVSQKNDPFHRVLQNSTVHQRIGASNSMLDMDRSPSQLVHPMVNSPKKRNHFQGSRLQASQVAAASLRPENLTSEKKYYPQSVMGVTSAQPAFSSSPDPHTTGTSDWQLLLTQFHR